MVCPVVPYEVVVTPDVTPLPDNPEDDPTPYVEVTPVVPYWAGWYELPVYLTPDWVVDPYCDEVNPAPDKLLELEATDEVILSMLDEEVVPYGVPVILESSGLRRDVVVPDVWNDETFSSNSLINVFLDLNWLSYSTFWVLN